MYVTSPTDPFSSQINVPTLDPENDLNYLHHCPIKSVPAGTCLFHEGDKSSNIYEIIEGVVRSSKLLADGRQLVLNFGYPTDVVGFSHDCRYHYECDAVSDLKVRVIHKNACRSEISEYPELSKELLRLAAAEISYMQEHFIMLGRKTATEKVTSFLIAIYDRSVKTGCARSSEIHLPMKRSDIGDFLGLSMETVSRTLAKLKRSGILNLKSPSRVEIMAIRELRKLAENSD